jgi:hypothetical protein
MARQEIPQVSFVKGEVSPIAADRTDSQFYASALQTCVNAIIHAEGGASNRPGLQFIGNCLSNVPNGSYLVPFIYSNQQTYVFEFAAGSMQAYSNGAFVQGNASATITAISLIQPPVGAQYLSIVAINSFTNGLTVTISGVVSTGTINVNQTWVISGANPSGFTVYPGAGSFTYGSGGTVSVPYLLTNPYTLADLPNLRWAQSADTLNIVVDTQPLYQLKRLTANSFSLLAPQLLFGPFQDLNTDGSTYVYTSGVQGTVTITASKGIFTAAHVGALFTIQEQFFNSITPWEAQKIIVYLTGSSPVGMYIRSDGKIYQCVASLTSTDHTSTGTFQPVHTSGTQQDGDGQPVPNFVDVCGVSWQFISTNAGVAKITQYISPTQVQATVQSYKGIYANFPPTVVGGPQTVQGPWTFNGTGSQKTFTPLTGATATDPNQFYATVGGVFQDPTSYTISGTSITFYAAPSVGTGNVVVAQVTGTLNNIYATASSSTPQPMTGLCLSTYWAFGSISTVQGYASDVCYFNDRLVLAGTPQQPQTFFTSRVSDYLNFGVSSPQIDSDAITETINSRQQNPINNLLPMNNLLMGTASASWRVTGSTGLGTITPSDISIIPQEFYGMHPVPAVQTGTTIIYVQWGGRKLRDILYQFYNDKFLGKELTVFARQVFPYGTNITRLAFAPEPYGLVYCVRSDGALCVCTYLPEQEVVAWSRWTTQGNFEDVCVVPESLDTDGDGVIDSRSFSVYVIVGRTVGGSYQRYIERFAPREYETIADAFFVDSGLTYNGRNVTPTTMTVNGGSTWKAQDTGFLTASAPTFASSDVGNAIWLVGPGVSPAGGLGDQSAGPLICRLQISSFITTTQVNVTFLDPVPVSSRVVATTNWIFARTTFSGLTNLAGQTVSVFADGGVQPTQVVSATGSITLPVPSGIVHAGLSYVSQLQSLNLNIQGGQPIRNHQKTIPTLSVVVDQSLPFMVGPDFTHMVPIVQRQFEPYNQPVAPYTGVLHAQLETLPTDDAYVCVEMSDPAPMRILGWVAIVDIGEAG